MEVLVNFSGQRDICDECQREIVYHKGPVRQRGHWQHMPGQGTKQVCKGAGESAYHRLAKHFLMYHLMTGKTLTFASTCRQCDSSMPLVKIPAFSSVDQEYKYVANSGEVSFFDVVCLNKDNQIVFGIEVWASHKTKRVDARAGVPWVEVRADDVLILMDPTNNPISAHLTDHREHIGCKKEFCLPMVEIACALGFSEVYDPYVNDACKLADEAMRGKYRASQMLWLSRSNGNKPPYGLWNAFLARRRCLRCSHPHDTSYMKPYCLRCYKQTCKEDQDGIDVNRWLPSDRKVELRKALYWINALPGNWRVGAPCHFCAEEYLKRDDHGYVWWFGDKKRCCATCLDIQCRQRGLIQ